MSKVLYTTLGSENKTLFYFRKDADNDCKQITLLKLTCVRGEFPNRRLDRYAAGIKLSRPLTTQLMRRHSGLHAQMRRLEMKFQTGRFGAGHLQAGQSGILKDQVSSLGQGGGQVGQLGQVTDNQDATIGRFLLQQFEKLLG